MSEPSGGPGFRDVFAPEVSARLASGGPGDLSTVALAAVLTVLFGAAGLTILISGAAPRDASPALFGAVAGGGSLLIALVAALLAVRGATRLRQLRAAARAGQYVSRHELVLLAQRNPAAGELVGRTQRSVSRIRSSAAYRAGDMSTVFGDGALRRIEWMLTSAALRCPDGDSGLAALSTQVARLETLAGTAERLGAVTDQGPEVHLAAADRIADELDGPTLVADEMLHLRRNDH